MPLSRKLSLELPPPLAAEKEEPEPQREEPPLVDLRFFEKIQTLHPDKVYWHKPSGLFFRVKGQPKSKNPPELVHINDPTLFSGDQRKRTELQEELDRLGVTERDKDKLNQSFTDNTTLRNLTFSKECGFRSSPIFEAYRADCVVCAGCLSFAAQSTDSTDWRVHEKASPQCFEPVDWLNRGAMPAGGTYLTSGLRLKSPPTLRLAPRSLRSRYIYVLFDIPTPTLGGGQTDVLSKLFLRGAGDENLDEQVQVGRVTEEDNIDQDIVDLNRRTFESFQYVPVASAYLKASGWYDICSKIYRLFAEAEKSLRQARSSFSVTEDGQPTNARNILHQTDQEAFLCVQPLVPGPEPQADIVRRRVIASRKRFESTLGTKVLSDLIYSQIKIYLEKTNQHGPGKTVKGVTYNDSLNVTSDYFFKVITILCSNGIIITIRLQTHNAATPTREPLHEPYSMVMFISCWSAVPGIPLSPNSPQVGVPVDDPRRVNRMVNLNTPLEISSAVIAIIAILKSFSHGQETSASPYLTLLNLIQPLTEFIHNQNPAAGASHVQSCSGR